jgi:Ca2+-transporting ATPase
LFNIALGFTTHSETASTFNRDVISDRRQLGLVGLALLLTILPTQLAFLQRMLGLTELNGEQWLVAIGLAVTLVLVDEVIKLFSRRSLERSEVEEGAAKRASRQVETV